MINPLNVAALVALAGALACVFSLICGSPRFFRKVGYMLEILNAFVSRLVAAHDKIAALKAERDAALARVAELEGLLGVDPGAVSVALNEAEGKLAAIESVLA